MLRRLGKDVAIYGGADFLFRFSQLLVVPVYTLFLSVAEFGILSLLTVSATLFGMVAALGVNNSVQRFYFDPDQPADERPALVSTGLLQLIVSASAVTALALLLALAMRDTIEGGWGIDFALILAAVAIILPEQLAQYCLDSVRLQFRPAKFLAIAVVKNLGAVLLGLLFLIQFDMGVLGLLLGISVAAALAVPIGLVMMRRDLTLAVARPVAAKVFRYGYPFVLAGAAYWVFGSMGQWMLSAYGDVAAVGLFAIGLKFAAVMSFVITAFAQAWSPFALRMYGEDPDYLQNWSRVFSGWFFLLAFAGLGLALFAPEMMRLLTPPDYWSAAPILALASIGLVFYGTVQLTVLGISIAKRTVLLTYGAWMAAGANIILNLALIPWIGALGAAIANLLSYVVLTSAFLFWSQKLHPMPLDRLKLGYSLLVVALAVGATAAMDLIGVGVAAFAIKALVLMLAAGGAFLVGIVDPRLYGLVLRRDAGAAAAKDLPA